MGLEFVARNGLISQNNVTVTGSTLISSSAATQFQIGNNILFVSSSGNIGFGTTTPTYKFQFDNLINDNVVNFRQSSSETNLNLVNAVAAVQNASGVTGTYSLMSFQNNASGMARMGSRVVTDGVSGDFTFQVRNTNFIDALYIKYNGNTLIGTTTDSGYKLDVSGSGRFSNNVTVTGSLTATSLTASSAVITGNVLVQGTASINTLIVTGSKVGINTSTPTGSLHISGSILNYPITIPTSSGTASLDCSQSNFFNLTLSGSYTLFLSASNIQPGQTINLRVTQPATSGSLNYGSQFKFAGGIPYSASSTGSAVDIISFISFDTSTLYGSAIKNLS